jgi:hypothetical protein
MSDEKGTKVTLKIPTATYATIQDLKEILGESFPGIVKKGLQLVEVLTEAAGGQNASEFGIVYTENLRVTLNFERSAEVYEKSLAYKMVQLTFTGNSMERTQALRNRTGVASIDEVICLGVDVLAQFVHAARKTKSWDIELKIPSTTMEQLLGARPIWEDGYIGIRFGSRMKSGVIRLMPDGTPNP